MKITHTQKAMLRELLDRPDGNRWGWGSSCTNPTGSALEKQGLVECEFDRSKGCIGFPWSRWVLTDEGRKLAETLL